MGARTNNHEPEPGHKTWVRHMGQGDFNFDLPEGESFAPTPERVEQFVGLLPKGPFHLGHPGSNRDAWEPIRAHEAGQRILADAHEAANLTPLPLVTDAIYEQCLDDGSPAPMNAVAPLVRMRMALLPLAECLEPSGQHLEQIEQDIVHTLGLRSWIHPNNDTDRSTYDGQTIFNDLSSLHTASLLVAADYLLGDQLQAETRAGIRREVRRRALTPFRQRIESGKDIYWWVTVTHNWNSVCLLETVACALALEEDARDRAWYVAAAGDLIRYSEKGFTESGFYTEGTSYWAYGYGCYVTLAELVRAATGGKVDWLTRPLAQGVADFGRRMEVQDGVYPTFADCRRNVDLPDWLLHWMNNRRDPARTKRDTVTPIDNLSGNPFRSAQTALLVLFHQVDVRAAYAVEQGSRLRDWWEDEQFLICRPRPEADVRLASTFKGGDNGVNHNHNDLGTFTVLLGERELLTDPGAEVYTERTFSAQRYEGALLNSFGHPVPVVAETLQPPEVGEYTVGVGGDIRCALVETRFSDDEDCVVLDLTGAYRVASLQQLTRAFTHCRQGEGHVEVVDTVQFSQPEAFETALITYAWWALQDDGAVHVSDGDACLEVTVSSDDGDLSFDHSVIEESSTPTRLCWRFDKPVAQASVRMQIKPVTD